MFRPPLATGALAAVLVTACGAPRPSKGDLVFVDGRAVAASGDSILAFTRQDHTDITLRDRRTWTAYSRGGSALRSPHHLQERGGKWYVSDVSGDTAWIVVFDRQWEVERRIRIDTIATAPHQFAVLPDGRIVLEAPDGRLVALTGDSSTTFALVQQSARTGMLLGALGGVLHAVPERAVTLYNANGNIRWRLPWQWREDAFASDLALDAQGRIHLLAGEPNPPSFVCFSLSSTTGEVVRWSEPGPGATFTVDRLGAIRPDSADRWLAPEPGG